MLRIVVSGYAGTGKTSLCTALAERRGLAAIPEAFGPLLEAELQFVRAARQVAPGMGLDPTVADRLADAYATWGSIRQTAYDAHGDFIADRWEADLLACWLSRFSGLSLQVDSHTARLLRDMQAKAKGIDLVLITPLEPQFAGERTRNEAGLAREQNLTKQLAYHAWIDSLVRRFARVRVAELPKGASLEQRVSFVEQIIAMHGRDGA